MSADSVPSAIRPARSAPSHGFRQRRTKRKQHLDAAASAPRTACDKLSNHLMNSFLLISGLFLLAISATNPMVLVTTG